MLKSLFKTVNIQKLYQDTVLATEISLKYYIIAINAIVDDRKLAEFYSTVIDLLAAEDPTKQ